MARRPSKPRYSRTFPPEPRAVRTARDEVAGVARGCGVSDDELHAIRLSVTEIVTNSIRHAYGEQPGDGDEILVEVFQEDGQLLVMVADKGPGIAPQVGSPGLGLGLPVVASLTQRLELVPREGGGAEVLMAFRCPNKAPVV